MSFDPERSSKQFVVECKRLGRAVRVGWVLNLNYVKHGIERFRNPDWAYAKRSSSGVMIGYWQNMDIDEVFKEVNKNCHEASLPDLVCMGASEPWAIRVASSIT